MAPLVYLLCAATSLLCTILLGRAYTTSKLPLLRWSALCFAGLTLSNILLFVDLILLPHMDSLPARRLVTLASLGCLIFGLTSENR